MDTGLNKFHNAFPYRKTQKYTYVSNYGTSADKGIQANHARGIYLFFMHVMSTVPLLDSKFKVGVRIIRQESVTEA